MDIHIDWDWIKNGLGLLVQFPVLVVLVGGMFLGICFSQFIKLGYLAAHNGKPTVSLPRYNFGVRTLSALSTYFCTIQLWDFFLHHDGIEELVCLGWGTASPIGYAIIKATAKKFIGEDFVKGWGDKEDEQ